MPPVVIPVAIAIAGAGVTVSLGLTTLTAAAISVGVTAAAAGASYLMAPDAVGGFGISANPEAAAAPINGARSTPVRQAIPPRRFAYGRSKLGGAIFFQDNNNPYLFIGTALSDGVIEGVEAVYFGDTSIPYDGTGVPPSGNLYFGKFKIETSNGDAAQVASALLLAGFPTILDSTFIQSGVARACVRLDWGTDAQNNSVLWGNSISPSFLTKGVRVYDPRDPAQSVNTPTTWTYSTNPALHVAHALINAWGVALAPADMDWSSVSAAANVCDTTTTYGGNSVKYFVGAGVFQAGSDMAGQLADMLSAFDGAITFSDGLYRLYADSARTSVWTITDDDILEIGEFPHDNETRARFNAIKAGYYDATDAGLNATTPVYEITAAIAAEGLRETSIQLPFTAETYSAQILAYRALQRSQQNQSFNITTHDAGLWIDPFELVTINSTAAPFLNGTYEAVQIDPTQEGAIFQLRPYRSAVYADPTGYLV